jgi:alanine or glycine:cation symporter, AGCS family
VGFFSWLDHWLNHPTAEHWLDVVDTILWGAPLIVILLGTGIVVTVALGFPQVVAFVRGWALLAGKDKENKAAGAISPVQALATSLSGTIGTGNIVGVATAIALGGPGALFWMWMTAVFGMALKMVEGALGVLYREVDEETGTFKGGPMYFFTIGLKREYPRLSPYLQWMAYVLAAFLVIVALNSGNMVQVNALIYGVRSLGEVFGATVVGDSPSLALRVVVGLVLSVVLAVILIGGIKRIGKVAGALVPLMGLIYVGAGLLIILGHPLAALLALGEVFDAAFNGRAATGGFAGAGIATAMRFGVARGLFSNEAGQGTAPIAHSAARTNQPMRQGLLAMLGPFIDTIVVCSITGVILVMVGPELWGRGSAAAGYMTSEAFGRYLGDFGRGAVSIATILLCFTTILSWYYYGEKGAEFLAGKVGVYLHLGLYIVSVIIGALTELDVLWLFADIVNGLLAVPNLIAILLLLPVVHRLWVEYWKPRT